MDLLDRHPPGPAWAALFAALRPLLRGPLERLGALLPTTPPPFEAGEEGGPWAEFRDGKVRLSPALLSAGVRAPEDEAWAARAPEGAAPLALDRWRRAAGAWLEGLVLAGMAERHPEEAAGAWWREGRAAEAVDRAAPELGWIWPELVDLLGEGEPSLAAHPRRAAWLFRWLRARPGGEGDEAGLPALTGADLAAFGAWIRDPLQGPAAGAPVPLSPAPPSAWSGWTAPPWSFRAVRLGAGPAGARLEALGAGLAGGALLLGGEEGARVLGAVEGGEVELLRVPLGPIGTWILASGRVQDRLGAARGVELALRSDGRLEIVLADAFMGLPTAEMLALAESVGVSGWAGGRWRVVAAEGPEAGEILLDTVRPKGLTLHPRGGHAFAVPAASVIRPAEQILAALSGARLRWRRDGEALILRGEVLGLQVELRLRAEGGSDALY